MGVFLTKPPDAQVPGHLQDLLQIGVQHLHLAQVAEDHECLQLGQLHLLVYNRSLPWWFLTSIDFNTGLQELSTTLWALTNWPSLLARVTSVKSVSLSNLWKEDAALLINYSHFNENLSEDILQI